VRQSEYLIDRKNAEIEQLRAQLVQQQRQRFEDERDQVFTFALIFAFGFFTGVGVMWWGLM
jgi:hypothetical protein